MRAKQTSINKNKRIHLSLCEILELIFILFLSFGTYFIVYIILKGASWSNFWDIPVDKELVWLLTASGVLCLVRFTLELGFKNSFKTKQLSRCALFTVVSSTTSTLILRLIFYFSPYSLAIFPSFVETISYFAIMVIVMYIFKYFDKKKKQRIVIVANKDEAINYAVKLIKNGNKKDSIHALFADNEQCTDSYIKQKISECDVVYFGKTINSHLKNIYLSLTIGEFKKEAYVVPNTYEILSRGDGISRLGDTMALESKPLELNWFQKMVKRLFDIFSSGIAIILFSPLMVIVAILIKCQDGGPALFKQERVTKDGRVFVLLKFRSMIVDAEKKTGAVLMKAGDNRLTRFGKFIRATRLDELPQLFNIFKGDMSVIGPRPERPIFVEQYLKDTPEYKYRLNVKAGLSGYAQVKGTYNTSFKDKLRWDLMYISNYSFALDIYILFKTVIAIFDKGSAAGLEGLDGFEFLDSCGRKYKLDEKHIHIYTTNKKDN